MAIITSTKKTNKVAEKTITKSVNKYLKQHKYPNEIKEINVEVHPIFSRDIL